MSDLTPEMLAEINEFVEGESYVNYFLCAPPEFAKPFRLEARRVGPVWVTAIPAVDNVTHNRIMGFGVGKPGTESVLDDAIAVFQSAGCKNYMAAVSSLAQPAHYSEWFAARGFNLGRNWAKMYRGNEPTPAFSTDLRVETIGVDQADAYADVMLSVFGMTSAYRPLLKGNIGKPGWYHSLAFAGDKPVSAGTMFVNGEVAWMNLSGTLMGYRKRGAQNAMLARGIEMGLSLGCKWFVAETREDTPESPNPSYHNMLRKGFKLAYLQRCFYHQSPVSFGEKIRRALFVASYGLRFEGQRLMKQKKKAGR